jgi:hypothetical protein
MLQIHQLIRVNGTAQGIRPNEHSSFRTTRGAAFDYGRLGQNM